MNSTVSFKQILQGFVALIVLIALLWVAFYALIVVLVVAICATAYFFIRRFLIKQGILQGREHGSAPADQAPMDESPATIIETTDYSDVTQPNKPQDKPE